MHDAAHAALLASGHETPHAPIKQHQTLISEFGRRLVLTGRLDAAFGRAFNKVHNMRLLADYSSEPPSIEDAGEAVEKATAFVAAIRLTLAALPGS